MHFKHFTPFIIFFIFFISNLEARGTYITDIKHWSNPNYTRIAIYISKRCEYKHDAIDKKNSSGKLIYLTLLNTRLNIAQKRELKFNEKLINKIKIELLDNDTKIIFDSNGFDLYKVNSFNDPFRIIVDIEKVTKPKEREELDETKLSEILLQDTRRARKIEGAHKVKIIIDPGHGGKDPGAIFEKTQEKDIVLDVSKKLYKIIKKDQRFIPYLTRNKDIYISLEERTAIANINKGALFISIHVNFSQNKEARGLEIYYLDMTEDKGSIKLAARENGTGELSVLEFIKIDLAKTLAGNESVNAARLIQKTAYEYLEDKSLIDFENRTAKSAMFYVLWGTKMPSILAEIGFLSNKEDAKLLKRDSYREKISMAIYNGILCYFNYK